MKRKKQGGIESIKRRYGNLFIAPWVFGVVLFVVVPVFTFLRYGFSDIEFTSAGIETTFVGLKHYKYVFTEYPYYADSFRSSLTSMITSLPIIVALSLILAIILNQKFYGRTFARAVFFLPVIIAAGVVMDVVNGFGMSDQVTSAVTAGADAGAAASSSDYMEIIDFVALLERFDLPDQINNILVTYLTDTFNLIWKCGIQILLFVAGLQTIPSQLYEAGKVEGITAWEQFWYITFPMMSRIVLLVVFYTMVELFTENGSLVESAIRLMENADYTTSSAMLWPYFAAVGATIGLIMFLFNRYCLKKWE